MCKASIIKKYWESYIFPTSECIFDSYKNKLKQPIPSLNFKENRKEAIKALQVESAAK